LDEVDQDQFIRCAGGSGACVEQIARDAATYATESMPSTRRTFPIPLVDGTWWAYRDHDASVSRVYCPAHQNDLPAGRSSVDPRHD
jgi:hypothetical protein